MTCVMQFVSRLAKKGVGCPCGRRCRRVIEFVGVRLPACEYHIKMCRKWLERRGVAVRVRWIRKDADKKEVKHVRNAQQGTTHRSAGEKSGS